MAMLEKFGGGFQHLRYILSTFTSVVGQGSFNTDLEVSICVSIL